MSWSRQRMVLIALVLASVTGNLLQLWRGSAPVEVPESVRAETAKYQKLVDQFKALTRPVPGNADPTVQDIVDRFHKLYYTSQNTWQDCKWLGVTTLQNPNDVWITQEIICEVKPDVIVECGTAQGGSAVLWAQVLREVNPQGKVITIDIEDISAAARALPLAKERVEFLIGSSTAPEIVEKVKKATAGKKVMVILDSDHREPHVSKELEIYSPLVAVGSYLIVQDTNVNGHPVYPNHGPGPMEALEKFMAKSKDYETDRARERLLFTMHPKGYLRRVR